MSEKIAEYVALYGKVAEDPAYDDSKDKTSHQVHLYLPQAIQVTNGVTYNTNMQLGFIGGLAENAMNRGASVAGRVASGAAAAVVAVERPRGCSTGVRQLRHVSLGRGIGQLRGGLRAQRQCCVSWR